MIIIESLLTTFEGSSIFEAAEEIAKIGLSLKPIQAYTYRPALSNIKKNFATNVATEASLSPHLSKNVKIYIFTWQYDKSSTI